MKDSIRISLIGIGLAGCLGLSMLLSPTPPHNPVTLTTEEVSWIEFCRANGYSIHTDDEDIINEYLDIWRGSAEEEEALARSESKS